MSISTKSKSTSTADAVTKTVETVKISAALKAALNAALKSVAAVITAQRAVESSWKTLGKKLRDEFPDKDKAALALKQLFTEHFENVEELEGDELKNRLLSTSRDRSNVLTFAFPTVPESEVERQLTLAESHETKIRVQDELSIRRGNAKINKKGELIKLTNSYTKQDRTKATPAVTFAAKLRDAVKAALLAQIDEQDAKKIMLNILKDTYHVTASNTEPNEEE